MGIDAVIGVACGQWDQAHPLVPELEDLIHDSWQGRSPEGVSDSVKIGLEPGWVEILSGQRYFSLGCPRGYWPTIRRVLEILRTMYPEVRIVYGDDASHYDLPECPDLTDEVLAECDRAWVFEKPRWDATLARLEGVEELRKLTGAPVKECLAAYDAVGGDIEAARERIVVTSTEGSFDQQGRHVPARPSAGGR